MVRSLVGILFIMLVFVNLETAGKNFKTDYSTLKVIMTSNGFILVPIVSVYSLFLIPTNMEILLLGLVQARCQFLPSISVFYFIFL